MAKKFTKLIPADSAQTGDWNGATITNSGQITISNIIHIDGSTDDTDLTDVVAFKATTTDYTYGIYITAPCLYVLNGTVKYAGASYVVGEDAIIIPLSNNLEISSH